MWHCEIKKLRQQGMVLLSILFFMQIIALLGLYGLQIGVDAKKTSRLEWQQTVLKSQAEEILQKLENRYFDWFTCLVPLSDTNAWLTKPLNDWRSAMTCKGHDQTVEYHYVVEQLGQAPCVEVKDFNRQENSAVYFRLTLIVIQFDITQRLQSTLLIVRPGKSNCNGPWEQKTVGRQTWLTH